MIMALFLCGLKKGCKMICQKRESVRKKEAKAKRQMKLLVFALMSIFSQQGLAQNGISNTHTGPISGLHCLAHYKEKPSVEIHVI